jgi:hypothetical protein
MVGVELILEALHRLGGIRGAAAEIVQISLLPVAILGLRAHLPGHLVLQQGLTPGDFLRIAGGRWRLSRSESCLTSRQALLRRTLRG